MINSFEHRRIKISKLPTIWQEDGALEELEKFLQSNWEQRKIFYSDGYVTSRQQFIDFDKKNGIKVQNYIGTIIFRGEQLNIFPKIFKEDEDDYDIDDLQMKDLIDNLIIWLGYCDKFNFPFVSMKGELDKTETLMELFITVYLHYVKAAIDRQLFFRYEDVEGTGSFAKGKIDLKDYMTRKYPTGQCNKLNYTYSSFVFDNLINQIIKCTCQMLDGITTQTSNRRIIHDILMKLGDVSNVNCMPFDCDKIHLNALQSNYKMILSMSKMFLLNKVTSQSIGITDTFCFLFPAELLFEGFIGGFMKEMFDDEAKVSTQTSDQYLADLVVDGEVVGNAFRLREDILVETKDEIVILDTKYKEIDRFEKVKENKKLDISDADMKQMVVYVARRDAKRVFLLYPLHRNEKPETIEIRYDVPLEANIDSKKIPIEILKVPFAFGENIDETKKLLSSILKKTIVD